MTYQKSKDDTWWHEVNWSNKFGILVSKYPGTCLK